MSKICFPQKSGWIIPPPPVLFFCWCLASCIHGTNPNVNPIANDSCVKQEPERREGDFVHKV